MTRLFHFSDDPAIAVFAPRPVRVPSVRPPGRDWLNGPLVWAIDEWHQPLYLFPRNAPRILAWPVATTTAESPVRFWNWKSDQSKLAISTELRAPNSNLMTAARQAASAGISRGLSAPKLAPVLGAGFGGAHVDAPSRDPASCWLPG